MGDYNGHLIGYGQLANWAQVVCILEPVYASLISESDTSNHGVRYEQAIILCTQPKGEIVHDCRIPVAAIQWIADTCLTENHGQCIEHAHQVGDVVLGWLKDQSFIILDEVVAIPWDLKLLDGYATFMK